MHVTFRSSHRLIRDDTFRLNWIIATRRISLNEKYHKSEKCCLWLACADKTGYSGMELYTYALKSSFHRARLIYIFIRLFVLINSLKDRFVLKCIYTFIHLYVLINSWNSFFGNDLLNWAKNLVCNNSFDVFILDKTPFFFYCCW